jgi:hypothetical protein
MFLTITYNQQGKQCHSHFKYQRATPDDDLPNEHPVLQVHNATYTKQYIINLYSEYGLKCCLHNSVCLTPNFVCTHKVITDKKMAFHQKHTLDSFEYEYTKYVVSYRPIWEPPDCNCHGF